jgi:hypothetical protein
MRFVQRILDDTSDVDRNRFDADPEFHVDADPD